MSKTVYVVEVMPATCGVFGLEGVAFETPEEARAYCESKKNDHVFFRFREVELQTLIKHDGA